MMSRSRSQGTEVTTVTGAFPPFFIISFFVFSRIHTGLELLKGDYMMTDFFIFA